MHILIAPNAFKNSLDANSVAKAIKDGFQQSKLKCTTELFPVGDGGDGTGELIIQKCNGNIIHTKVHDALGRKIKSSFGLIDENKTAVIELANASGIKLLKQRELDPLHANTFGSGELITKALDKNVNKIILCIGGSATIDGGTGILEALGIKFFDSKGDIIKDLPVGLLQLHSIDLSKIDERILNCEFIILCDVKNNLLGESGAAKIFGPQKGAYKKDIALLEKVLTKFKEVSFKTKDIDLSKIEHGGAAGGVAVGLSAFCNAKLVNGIDYFLSLTSFDKSLQKANLVITGEGKIDSQTLEGKAPFGVAMKAKQKQIPVVAFAGKVEDTKKLNKVFDELISINKKSSGINTAIKNTSKNLKHAAERFGNTISITSFHTKNIPMKTKETNDPFSFLGAPAQRALASQGITSVKQLTNYTEKEILKLHGVGKTTIPKLKEALRAEGLDFKK